MLREGRVMFVDDEEGVRTSWERYFAARGLTTVTAPDGATAIDRLSRQPVDVVVSDMRMPGKNGLELLEWIHTRQPDTRFIMLTGYGDRRQEWEARQLGAVEYFEKPIAPDVLAYAIDRALDPTRLLPPLPVIELKPAAEPQQAAAPVAAAQAKRGNAVTVAQFLAAPFLGLAFVVFLPVLGLAAAAWSVGAKIRAIVA
jgi:DNA-binding NtrC family response regulator